MRLSFRPFVLAVACAVSPWACGGGGGGGGSGSSSQASTAESCMTCHNASPKNDYAGPGLPNPHPFPGAPKLRCTTCHGGNPKGEDKDSSHVPPPPQIGDEQHQLDDAGAWFNRLTLAGLDKLPDWTVGNTTYSALDYLQFINPGDLRVVAQGRACGQCHVAHADTTPNSMLATETGIMSGAAYAIGVENQVAQSQGLHEDTASDLGFRAVVDNGWTPPGSNDSTVPELREFPVFSVFGAVGQDAIFNNNAYLAAALVDDQLPDGRAITGSPLANLFHEQVAFTCGDCHLGSAGANNRYGDFRSSGCTACHMPYSRDGRYTGSDPNITREEPLDPDDIDAPERAHVREHRIVSVSKTFSNGVQQQGIDDHTCVGCHQGSNRTVMQYWGIRLDQNKDLRRGVQYPAAPVSWQNTAGDPRLFDAAVGNHTFNGRDRDQYILREDYDGDGRDDTPPDVHHEAGLGCIDCHGSFDLHGGQVAGGGDGIRGRMEHGVAMSCENCHGTVEEYAATKPGKTYAGQDADLVVDEHGKVQRHVAREADGFYWLTSRLDGQRHFVSQVRDAVVDTGRLHPETQAPLYNPRASFAMGRADGDAGNGLGPLQAGGGNGFSHSDTMECAACHSSWTNTCMGCHLEGEYNTGNNFSNVTGERIVFRQKNADFTYQSPVPFQLGIGPDSRISTMSANTKVFFQWFDRFGTPSKVFAFSDRNGGSGDPTLGPPSLSHNAFMAHSIRGAVEPGNEGARQCVACHLTDDGLAAYGIPHYDAFRAAMAAGDYDALDFAQLQQQIGRNPGNQLDSPLWVHMVAGLGSGLFLFDEKGAPVNPLDHDSQRKGAEGVAPASIPFDAASVAYDLDRIVTPDGRARGSNNHALLPTPADGVGLRDGATDPALAGPLGATLIQRLTDPHAGIVLDAWIDADGQPQGGAAAIVGGSP